MASKSLKKINKLFYGNKNYLAYQKLEGSEPGIIFLHGLKSDMTGEKAQALEQYAKTKKLSFIKFDFRGHGKSSGKFQDFGITDWTQDILFIIEKLTNFPQILIGSSMGGWIMLLAAIKRPKLINALIGIAAAPDFTIELYEKDLSESQKKMVYKEGYIELESEFNEDPYIISRVLLDQGKKNLLLNKPIPILCPVHLLHGNQDDIVPLKIGIKLLNKIQSSEKKLVIIGDAGHRFSENNQIKQILVSLDELLKKY